MHSVLLVKSGVTGDSAYGGEMMLLRKEVTWPAANGFRTQEQGWTWGHQFKVAKRCFAS
jgi:hypothetical protein